MNIETSMCASSNADKCWEQINWTQCFKQVRRLQTRIVKAWKEGKYNKVKSLQWILTKSFAAKALAVKRVTENKGGKTPGVDKIIWNTSERKYQAIFELTRKGYHAQPLKRIYIPKKNKSEKRPLGIPTMKDRAMQALYLMALEPISETTADNCSYGFRPQRATHDAIEHCFKLLSKRSSPEWILEGDIKGCFDNISHEWLINNIPIDKKVLNQWLSRGIVYKGEWSPTEAGTPQGGIISPTLAVMTLGGLEKILRDRFKQKRKNGKLWSPKVRLVQYADDFIVTGESREILEQEVMPILEQFLAERGLSLSNTKTKITNIGIGFDFLGQNIRKYKSKLLIKPSSKSLKHIVTKIGEIINDNKQCKQEHLILKLNPVIRGWCEYHKYSIASQIFYKLDHLIWQKLWKWCTRRHPNKGKKWVKDKYFKTACKDGLSGFSEAINTVFPKTEIQLCIIHQIRNSLKYVPHKEQKEFMADLKQVYQALTLDEAELASEIFKENWGKKHPIIIRSWEKNWLELTAYFKYSYELRKMVYTTNIIEGYHRQLRKVTKTKQAYPTDDALKKIIYLATVEAAKKWTMPVKDWKNCISQFAIYFGDRLETELAI